MIDLSRTRAGPLAEIEAPEPSGASLRDITDPRVSSGHTCVRLRGHTREDLFPLLKTSLPERFAAVPRPLLIRDLLMPLRHALGNACKHGNCHDTTKGVRVEGRAGLEGSPDRIHRRRGRLRRGAGGAGRPLTMETCLSSAWGTLLTYCWSVEPMGSEYPILREELRIHAAVRAWVAATSVDVEPEYLRVHRERRRKALYWLPGVAPGETSVYAKRAVAARTVIERTVYEEVLAHLSLTAPRYYGSWLDGPNGWLFVEDVGAQRYSEQEPEQLALAGRWIAMLHVGAARLTAARSLPDAGPRRYLAHLLAAREKITRSLGLWRYPGSETEVLAEILSHCDALEARWARVEAACHGAPATVVHGDFRPKNALLRRSGSDFSIYPIDWETAGWGPPGPDLTRIDLRAYWSVTRAAWRGIGIDTIERWQRMGRLLQEVAALEWVAENLKCESAEARSWAVSDLKAVLRRVSVAARAAGVLE